jgi:hypothetical protein
VLAAEPLGEVGRSGRLHEHAAAGGDPTARSMRASSASTGQSCSMDAMRRAIGGALAVMILLGTAAAAPAAGGPSATSPPRVTGPLQQGKKLTAFAGTWIGSGPVALAFQWYRCDAVAAHCSSVHGATAATYTQVAKDVGHSLGLTVRATDARGTAEAYAAAAGLVTALGSKLTASAQPPLTGDAIVGSTLRIEDAAWSAKSAATTVGWLRCNANGRACVPVAGQTEPSYTVTTADTGHTLVAAETATSASAHATVLSLRTAVVATAPGPVPLAPPSVSGIARQGTRLTAAAGTWSSAGAISYAFQWYRCDAAIGHCSSVHGATKGTYTVVAKDVGATIALTVRATDTTGTTAAYAPAVGTVAAMSAPVTAPSAPVPAGDAKVGKTLTAQPPKWSTPQGAIAYAWLRCNANGRACQAIPGATKGTYVVAAADASRTLVVAVTAQKQTVLSAPTGLVRG